MKVVETEIEGVRVLEPSVWEDDGDISLKVFHNGGLRQKSAKSFF